VKPRLVGRKRRFVFSNLYLTVPNLPMDVGLRWVWGMNRGTASTYSIHVYYSEEWGWVRDSKVGRRWVTGIRLGVQYGSTVRAHYIVFIYHSAFEQCVMWVSVIGGF